MGGERIRIYRHPSGTAPASPTLVHDSGVSVASDNADSGGVFSEAVDTTGWPAATYDITATAQDETGGKAESAYSAAQSIVVAAAGGVPVALDASFPVGAWSGVNVTSVDSPSFSIASGHLCVVLVNAWDNASHTAATSSFTDTAGTTWNHVALGNTVGTALSSTAWQMGADLYWAAGPISSNVVTAHWANTTLRASIVVFSLSNASLTAPLGGTNFHMHEATTSESLGVTVAAGGSLILGNILTAATSTAGASTSLLLNVGTGGETWGAIERTTDTVSGDVGSTLGVAFTNASATVAIGLAEIKAA